MRTVLCLSILLCIASSASAQIVQETTVYPGGYQHVANVTGPLGIFGYPVYAPVPPRAVTRTYDISPPVIVESMPSQQARISADAVYPPGWMSDPEHYSYARLKDGVYQAVLVRGNYSNLNDIFRWSEKNQTWYVWGNQLHPENWPDHSLATVEKQTAIETPRKTVTKTYFGKCRNPYCTCAPCRCGNSCRCGR